MAKVKKRGKRRSGTTLKFEIYGIAIILFAIISLAGKGEIPGIGPVGRSFSYIFHFFAGAHYYIIPLVGIYIGLFVMIKRTWPTASWSYRKTGVVLILLAILVHYQINLFAQMYPQGEFASKFIFNQPYLNLTEYLAGDRDVHAYKLGLGGGFIGALLYTVLHVLFDQLGSRLIVYALFAIGLLCATGWSLADIAQFIRKHSRGTFKGLRNRMHELLRLMAARHKERKAKKEIRARQAAERAEQAALEQQEAVLDDEEIEALIDQRQEEQRQQTRKKERPKIVSSGDFFPQQYRHTEEVHDEEAVGEASVPQATDGKPEEEAAGIIIPVFRDYRDYTDENVDEHPHVEVQTAEVDHYAELDEAAVYEPDEISDTWEADNSKWPHTDESELERVQPPAVEVQMQAQTVGTSRATRSVSMAAAPGQILRAEDLQDLDQDIVFEESPPEIPYQLPPFHLLNRADAASKSGAGQDYMAKAQKLVDTLQSFGVKATLLDVVQGPSVTRYEIQPSVGVTVRKIVSLTDDIALALAAKSIRMEAPIPEKSAIGIEVPNSSVSMVKLREVLESAAFSEASSKLTYSLGRDITGKPVIDDLARMPHLLVAGATGSGKSVCVNGIIVSILYKAKPDEVKFLMIDPKKVELNVYNGIPHLLAPVVTDPRRAALALKKVVVEMEKRYEMFSESKTRNLEGYNEWLRKQGKEPLPFIVVIVDELADLMMVAANDVEDAICRLAQMARASGIHLIIATQRPSVNVITGVIKANIPSRIAFSVSSQVDSRTILDSAGAEKLLGRGDMLFMPTGSNQTLRIQGAFLSDSEVEAVVQFCKEQGEAEYREELVPEIEEGSDLADDPEEELFTQAVQIVLEKKQASASVLQRSLRIGYNRAARIIDAMEAKGIIGPFEGSKPRNVLITEEEYNQRRMSG